MSILKLSPGFLVSLSTRVEGGLTYDRRELEDSIQGDGSEMKRWETTKIITDPEEHLAAAKLRQQARNMIAGVCVWSPFGLICPTDEISNLDEKISQAKVLIDEFNEGSQHTRIRLATIRGEIAENKAEAVAAVREEISGLVGDMERAVQLGDVKSIRDIAGRANQMGRLLEQQSSGRDALSRAVSAARKVARQIVKRVEDGAETVTQVIEDSNLSPISEARFAFDNLGDVTEELDATEHVDDEVIEEQEEAMPQVNLGRFSGLSDTVDTEGDTTPYTSPPRIQFAPGEDNE